MIWIGTDDGLIQVTTDDGEDVAERDAGGADVVEPRHDDRGVALSTRTRRTRRSIAISSGTSTRTSTARATSARRGRRSRAACRAAATCTSSRKIRRGAGCCSPEPSARVFVSFDDGDNWQSLQLNLPVDVGARFRDLRQRSDRRDARPRILGDRRHQSAAPDHGYRGARRMRISSSRPTRSTCCRATTTARRRRRTSRRPRIRRTARRSTTT